MMWELNFKYSNSIAGPVWGALLCTLSARYTSSKESELYSELLCWIILLAFFRQLNLMDLRRWTKSMCSTRIKNQSTLSSQWIVALSIGISCLYKTENEVIEFFPLLTLLLFMLQRYLQPKDYSSIIPVSLQPQNTTISTWRVTLLSLFAVFTLSSRDFKRSALSIIPTIALLLVYIALSPRKKMPSDVLPRIVMETSMVSLSIRIILIIFLAVLFEVRFLGFPSSRLAAIIASAFGKAFSWIFLIHTAQRTSWCVATTINTFSIITAIDLSILSTYMQVICCIISLFLAAGQTVDMLPSQMKFRKAIWILPVLALIPHVETIVNIQSIKSSAQESFDSFQDHPVEIIINDAKNRFEDIQRTQSQSYIAAYDEYQRRYGIEPPPGFQEWYEFATLHQSPIIDEFDTISNSILPFLKLSGKEILGIMDILQKHPDNEIWDCTYSSEEAQTRCTHSHRSFDRNIQFLFEKLLGDIQLDLPNIRFFVNHLDEPRVFIPPLLRQRGYTKHLWLNVTDLSHQSIYDTITRSCTLQHNNRYLAEKKSIPTFGLPFITDSRAAIDLCQHPEYSQQHGLVMGPTSFLMIDGIIPVLSTGTLSTMNDILYPSPAYFEPEFQYDEKHDIEWDEKYNKLYWAGSTTGGFASDSKWRNYHRQRFVTLGQNLGKQQYSYLQRKDGSIRRIKSPVMDKKLFDVFFTRIFQCERRLCRDQRLFFDPNSWADKDEAFRSRLVFDLDGNGISGRYYKLLASKSMPLKQTILREWHDDRLLPWVHYVPVSYSMDELPELILYLTSTKSGQQRAKEIAEQGREWFQKAFREIDFSIYLYRLLLELARLQDPTRPAIKVF